MYDDPQKMERQEALRVFAAGLELVLTDYDLLDKALTHSSCVSQPAGAGEHDNETLEFLGDAVLELAVSHFLFDAVPGRGPGDYTRLRASLVNRMTVARVARDMGIAPLIRLGKGEEHCGGRKRAALLADCLEALIAAVYLDAGWHHARDFVLRVFAAELRVAVEAPPVWDYKSMLQNYCQAEHIGLPVFSLVGCEGPDHRKHFEVEVHVQDVPPCRGEGASKKEAEQNAAHQALIQLNLSS